MNYGCVYICNEVGQRWVVLGIIVKGRATICCYLSGGERVHYIQREDHLLFVELCSGERVISYVAGPQRTVVTDVIGVAVTTVDLRGWEGDGGRGEV